jgi:hypothetical protein
MPKQRRKATARGSIRASALQPETDPHLYLEFGLAVPDSTPNLTNLKPVQISERLTRLHQRVTNRMMDALVGHTDDFNNFVRFFRHGSPLRALFTEQCTAAAPITPFPGRLSERRTISQYHADP